MDAVESAGQKLAIGYESIADFEARLRIDPDLQAKFEDQVKVDKKNAFQQYVRDTIAYAQEILDIECDPTAIVIDTSGLTYPALYNPDTGFSSQNPTFYAFNTTRHYINQMITENTTLVILMTETREFGIMIPFIFKPGPDRSIKLNSYWNLDNEMHSEEWKNKPWGFIIDRFRRGKSTGFPLVPAIVKRYSLADLKTIKHPYKGRLASHFRGSVDGLLRDAGYQDKAYELVAWALR